MVSESYADHFENGHSNYPDISFLGGVSAGLGGLAGVLVTEPVDQYFGPFTPFSELFVVTGIFAAVLGLGSLGYDAGTNLQEGIENLVMEEINKYKISRGNFDNLYEL
tara:strand:- start:1340 stop:1663 length:324 start_codon:yes stop_codon:yes gene_type:complete